MKKILENFKTDVKIAPWIYERALWLAERGRTEQIIYESSRPIFVDKDYGYDAFTAYALNVHGEEKCPTRHPNLLKTIYDSEYSMERLINAWATDLYNGTETELSFSIEREEGRWPRWVYTAILFKTHALFNEQA